MNTAETTRDSSRARPGWLADAVISGFVATGASTAVLVVAYWAVTALGAPDGDQLRAWMWGLGNNPVVSLSQGAPAVALGIHVVFGLIWALVYAWLVEPRLPLRGGSAGAVFVLIPWLLSVLVFLPATGAGVFGSALNAGPLPAIGNFLLHMVYGVTLGQLYDVSADRPAVAQDANYVEPREAEAMHESQRFGAAGILGGVLVGALLGAGLALLLPPTLPGEAFTGWPLALTIAGILAGGGVGAIIGSFAGLTVANEPETHVEQPMDSFDLHVLPWILPGVIIVVLGSIVTAIGLSLLSLTKEAAVIVAVILTALIAVFGWLLAGRGQSPRSSRETVSQSGH